MPFFTPYLPYAETHFKFKLPWSPLYRKFPEIFFEAPHQVIPGEKLPLWLVVKDAHLFPIKVDRIDFSVHNGKVMVFQKTFELGKEFNQGLTFWRLDFEEELPPGDYEMGFYVYAKTKRGKAHHFANWNLPGLPSLPLKVKVLHEALPYPSHWYAGEHHCHTEYTSDPVEFGAPVDVMALSAKVCGLDYVVFTDHSYNFNYDNIEYMNPVDPETNFQEFRRDCLTWNQKESSPILIPGEEVSCGNSRGENIHLLVSHLDHFIQGHGDSGRRWFKNKPDFSIAEVISQSQESAFFAAHPTVEIGKLERLIFRRGKWTQVDLDPRIHGLQFWNGSQNESFHTGKKLWIANLLAGRRLLPIAGNDAHGDLNRSHGVKTPLFSLKCHDKHVFGKVRTLFPSESLNASHLKRAFKGLRNCCTDGPFADLEFTPTQQLSITAQSNADFGFLAQILLFKGFEGQEECIELPCENSFEYQGFYPLTQALYFRLEVYTTLGKMALTSAIFLLRD